MKVSAIMPTADRAAFIPLAIHCFLAQTYQDAELIIFDNGTKSIFPFVPKHPRIHYYGPAAKDNIGHLRNLACEKAQGDIIVNWDDDDWYAPERIERQVDMLEYSRQAVTGFHRFFYYDVRTGLTYEYQYKGHGHYASGSTQCYRRSWWEKHPFRKASIGEDSTFSQEAANCGELTSFEAGSLMVARAHGAAPWKPAMGSCCFPAVPKEALPAQFFEDLQKVQQ